MLVATAQALINKFHARKLSYLHTFNPDSIYAKRVLYDLANFCRAHDSTFHKDARAHAVLEGRREVWLRIQQYLNLSVEDIYKLHKVHEIDNNKG